MDEYFALLERIIKGAEFIESITPDHPQWEDANKLYNDLCKEALKMRFSPDCYIP